MFNSPTAREKCNNGREELGESSEEEAEPLKSSNQVQFSFYILSTGFNQLDCNETAVLQLPIQRVY